MKINQLDILFFLNLVVVGSILNGCFHHTTQNILYEDRVEVDHYIQNYEGGPSGPIEYEIDRIDTKKYTDHSIDVKLFDSSSDLY